MARPKDPQQAVSRAIVRSRSSSSWQTINVPQQFQIAARDLVISFADVTSTTMLQRGYAAPNRLLRANLNRLSRALTAISQFSAGGDVSFSWSNAEVRVGGVSLDTQKDPNVRGAMRLLEYHYGNRGVIGLHIRSPCSAQQITAFLHGLRDVDRGSLRALSAGHPTVSLAPDLDELWLVLDEELPTPAPLPSDPGSPPESPSSRGTELLLAQPDLAWRALKLPTVPVVHQGAHEPLSEGAQRLMAMSIYTHLSALSQRLLSQREAIHSGDIGLPLQALQRMVIQVSCGLRRAPDYLLACALLGARDCDPHRRLAHTAIVTIGLGQQLGAKPEALVVLGLAAFLYGLGPSTLDREDDLSILQHLNHVRAMSPPKFQAIHVAAQARARNASLLGGSLSTEARLIRLASDFADFLDGTLTGAEARAPLSVASALLHLSQLHAPDVVGTLARWLGPIPAGSVVRLLDGRVAVIGTGSGHGHTAYPILDRDDAPLSTAAEPVHVEVERAKGAWRPAIQGWPVARPLVHLAAVALFQGCQVPLLAGSIDTRPPN